MYIYWLLIFWISKAMESTMLKRSKMVRWDVAFLGVTGVTGCLYPKEQRETKVSLMFSTGCHEVKHACFTMFTLLLFLVSLWVWFAIFHWLFNLAIWLTCRWVLLILACLLTTAHVSALNLFVYISVRLLLTLSVMVLLISVFLFFGGS